MLPKKRKRKGVVLTRNRAEVQFEVTTCYGVLRRDHDDCAARYWDRDVNAAINMLELLKSEILGQGRLEAFRRGILQDRTKCRGIGLSIKPIATLAKNAGDKTPKLLIQKFATSVKTPRSSQAQHAHSRMAIFVGLLLLVAVAVAGLAINRWLAPLNDHSKKYDELDTEGVEIVVQNQKPSHERRLKLALPDLSSIQARSPVGPMKSSIRSALKELRSRQMVQSLCSRFESRLKVTSETEAVKGGTTNATTDMTQILKPTRTRRRDARDAIVAPVLSASDLAKEAEITVNARSNNLNKFLRSYASNLDNAISTERRVDMSTTDAISVERGVVMSTDAEDDVDMDQPHKEEEEEITTSPCETFADCDESGMELELDLHTLRLEAEFSNQCDSPPTAGSEEDVSGLVEATECDPLVDEGDNNVDSERSTASKLSLAFTLSPDAISKFSVPELTHSEPETVSAPPAKLALSRFREQVPSNGRRARGALKI